MVVILLQGPAGLFEKRLTLIQKLNQGFHLAHLNCFQKSILSHPWRPGAASWKEGIFMGQSLQQKLLLMKIPSSQPSCP